VSDQDRALPRNLDEDAIDVSGMPTADEIFNRPPPPPWPSARPVITLLLEALPEVADDIDANIIEQAAITSADLTEELRAVRMVLSETLAQNHDQRREIARLRQRFADIYEQRRSQRSAAA
jgi:hypothetical protein